VPHPHAATVGGNEGGGGHAMTDGDVPLRDVVRAGVPARSKPRIAGQAAIRYLLDIQDLTPRRGLAARLFGVSPLSPAGRVAYRTAAGALAVGAQLDTLGAGWHVLHSVPVGENGDELAHLVVGSAGVFIVAIAVHPGDEVVAAQRTFSVAGVRYPHIRAMEHEMGRVEGLLAVASGVEVEVSGILAVVDPKSLDVVEAHRDVAVISATAILPWLRARARVVPPGTVDRIAAAAALDSTWGAPARDDDPSGLLERFGLLRHEVVGAWNRQRMWATIATAAAAGAFVVVTYTILLRALVPVR
jgi:hypothetical protein